MAHTPTDERCNDDVSCSDLEKYKDKLLEHEQSLRPHPHHGHQGEVVDQHGHSHTASKVFCLVNSNHKHQEHTIKGTAQLNVILGDILLLQLSN